MPKKITLSKTLTKRLKKITLSNENTGLLHEFIINEKGIRPIEINEERKGFIALENDYSVKIEIENNSNEIARLNLATFKDFIIIEIMKEDYVGIIPLKKLSNTEEFRFLIKGHQIKMTIQKN